MDSELNSLRMFIFRLDEFRWLALNITFSDTNAVVSCLAINSRASPVGGLMHCVFLFMKLFLSGRYPQSYSLLLFKRKNYYKITNICNAFVLYTFIRLEVMVEISWVLLHDNSSLHAALSGFADTKL